MKCKLLTALFLSLALSASAQEVLPQGVRSQLKKMESARIVESKTLDNGLKVNVRETADGYRFKQVDAPENTEYVSTKNRRVAVKHAPAEKPHWMESFEGWDGKDQTWLPDGWTRHYNDEAYLSTGRTWFLNKQVGIYTPAPIDGQYYMEILFNSKNTQNEWLDTPELTPQAGDYFTFYFIAQPFALFDMTKYDSKTKDFTERIQMWDFQVYMSVEGGSWERVYSFWEEFKDSSAYEMRMEQSYYGPRTIKFARDMTPYVGKNVKFRLRYSGQDGDSMFFDLLELGKPYVTAGYSEPGRTCNFGMTKDFKTPVNWAYYPDEVPLTWTNQSSLDATTFKWEYTDALSGETKTANTRNLSVSYAHKPETVGSITNANVYNSPVLTAGRDGYQSGTYSGSTERIKIGGKTYVNIDGKEYHCGAGTYNYAQGYTAMVTEKGYPICGFQEGETSPYWYDVNGVSSDDYEISVIGLYNTFSTPDKPYKIRGLWIHGIGQIERKNNLTVTIHTLNEEGVIEDVPIATAYLDYDSIQTYNSAHEITGLDYPYITLPFLFADPVEVNRFILVRLNGIADDGVTYFAPLQSRIPDENGAVHGYLRMTASAVDGGSTNTGITGLDEIESELGPCYASFYMTLDMAYGDCDDWGHLDNVRGGNSMLRLENGHLQYYVPLSTEGLYDRVAKAAFYDATTSFNTSLYICAGALEQGDDPKTTNHIRIQMPKLSFGKDVDLSVDPVTTVAFYNCMNSTYYTASEGTLKVTKTANGYNVSCDVFDENDNMYFGAIYEDLPWMDATIKKVVPNDLRIYYIEDSIHSETDELEEYKIRSAYVNTKDASQYVIYLAVQEGIDSEEKMLALEGEPAIIIKAPADYLNNYYWGYSALYNEHFEASKKVSITFRGVEYSPENVFGVTQTGNADASLALGGTVYGVFTEGKLDEVEFFLSAVKALGGRCVKGHYSVATATAIQGVNAAGKQSARYNLSGQRVDENYRGIVIQNGKKMMVK